MDEGAMDRVRRLVWDDPTLRSRLLPLRDRASFTRAVAEIAAENGEPLGPEDVDQALTEARRRWYERWI